MSHQVDDETRRQVVHADHVLFQVGSIVRMLVSLCFASSFVGLAVSNLTIVTPTPRYGGHRIHRSLNI